MQSTRLEEAVNELPFSLIDINKPGQLEERLPQLLGVAGGAFECEVKQADFKMLVLACDSWGFQSVLHGDAAAIVATLSKRFRETGATRVGWTRSRPFGDVAMEKTNEVGLRGHCLFLLADSSGGPVFAFAVAPRTLESRGSVREWWLAGHGLTSLTGNGRPKNPMGPEASAERRTEAISSNTVLSPPRESASKASIPRSQQLAVTSSNELTKRDAIGVSVNRPNESQSIKLPKRLARTWVQVLGGALLIGTGLLARNLPAQNDLAEIGRFGIVVGIIGAGAGLILLGIATWLSNRRSESANAVDLAMPIEADNSRKARWEFVWHDSRFRSLFKGMVAFGMLLFFYLAYVVAVGISTGEAPLSPWIAGSLICACVGFTVTLTARGVVLSSRFRRQQK